jgi:phospholipase/carboxylesterase
MSQPTIEIETSSSPTASVIWLHGLGADGNDFVPIVPELNLPDSLGIRFIFPHAPERPVTCNGGYVMRAWYDIYSLDNLDKEDHEGMRDAQHIVESLIQQEMDRGMAAQRIILMGFSQGGAVALYSGLRFSQRLGGIGALSTYLPLADMLTDEKHSANADIPIFMAHGQFDPVVRYALGESSCQALQQRGYPMEWHRYPMEHSVCLEEIRDIGHWLTERLAG